MTPATKRVLEAMLAWDGARIAATKGRHPERSFVDYEERQGRATVMLAAVPAEDWTLEIREHFRQLLETAGELVLNPIPGVRRPSFTSIAEGGVGQARTSRGRGRSFASAVTREAVIDAANEIGALEILKRAGSSLWRSV